MFSIILILINSSTHTRYTVVKELYIGVISDSHDNIGNLREVLINLRDEKIDLLIHLGDIISPFTLRIIRELLGDTRVIIVRGNNDGDIYQLTNLSMKYNWVFRSEPGIVDVNGRRAFIMHGYGSIDETTSLVNALKYSMDVDLILYGHTHRYHVEKLVDKLVLNPGEVCGYLTNKATYALIDLDSMRADIRFLRVV